jgi:cytochrome P450
MSTNASALSPSEFTFPSPETLECPYPFYAAMRRDAPVYQLPGQDVYFVSRWEDIVATVERPDLFAPGRALEASLGAVPGSAAAQPACPEGAATLSAHGLANCDGPEHRLKRTVALKLVAPERLHRYEPFVKHTVDELIDAFAPRGVVELVSAFSTPLPVRVVCEMLGVPADDELFGAMMRQAPSSAVRFLDAAQLEERRQANEAIHDHMRRLVLARHSEPRDDFLSELVHEHARRAGPLPLEYLITEATTLLFGGLVTTQHMLTNTMFLLLYNPAQLRRVLADPSLIRPMLDESLRLEAPFHLTEMVCLADTELAGVPIPAGAAVYKVWGSGNRDEGRFTHADEFQIGRPNTAKAHLGFGRGAHRCLGAPLALLEGTIAFRQLLSRCRNLRFAPGANDWTHVDVPSFRSLNELHLEFDPLQESPRVHTV